MIHATIPSEISFCGVCGLFLSSVFGGCGLNRSKYMRRGDGIFFVFSFILRCFESEWW